MKARTKAAKQKAKKMRTPPAIKPKIELGTRRVEDPNWQRDHDGAKANPRFVNAVVNVRESAISTMVARGLLDECQAEAATRFRKLWEAMGGSGAGAMDYTKEPVDGGGALDPISDRLVTAGKEIARCQRHLGVRGYKLVSMVCGEGYQISEMYHIKRQQMSAMDALRGFLDDLAELWNLKRRTTMQRRSA